MNLLRRLKTQLSKLKSDKTQPMNSDIENFEEESDFILEKRVLEELFDQKLDEILSEKLREVSKEINKLGKSQFRIDTLANNDRKQIKDYLQNLLEKDNSKIKRPELGFIKDLLEVADGLENALEAAEKIQIKDQSINNWLDGISITQNRIMKLFEKWDIRPIDSMGETFNPNLHVSVDIKHTSEVPENTIVEEQRSGYLLGNEVIRYAEVVVSKPEYISEERKTIEDRNIDKDELVSPIHPEENIQKKQRGFILWSNEDSFID